MEMFILIDRTLHFIFVPNGNFYFLIGKFVEAAQIPQIKIMRLFLQMFKNLWDTEYVGGTHPLHPNVPKAVMQLYKQKIVEFFIPDIQENKGN